MIHTCGSHAARPRVTPGCHGVPPVAPRYRLELPNLESDQPSTHTHRDNADRLTCGIVCPHSERQNGACGTTQKLPSPSILLYSNSIFSFSLAVPARAGRGTGVACGVIFSASRALHGLGLHPPWPSQAPEILPHC